MSGDFPPSSSETRFRLPAERLDDLLARQVRAGEGHLVHVRVRGQGGAGGLAVAGHDVDDARGTPASRNSSPSRSAVNGASSAGFSTMVQPVASAGPTFQTTAASGPFHGMIAPTTPTGSLSVNETYSPGRP